MLANKHSASTFWEIARIQGFPDSFKFFYSYVNNAYKIIGNGVLINSAYEIALAIHNIPE